MHSRNILEVSFDVFRLDGLEFLSVYDITQAVAAKIE